MQTIWGNAKIDNKGYYSITSFKEGHHRQFLHRLIWEEFYHEKIPTNCEIHHKDGNKLNNCILNLQLLTKKQHMSLHMSGENNPQYNKHLSEASKKRISNANSGENHSQWKNYARIVKNGAVQGKQSWSIKQNGKIIKSSISIRRLKDWFRKEYPNDDLKVED